MACIQRAGKKGKFLKARFLLKKKFTVLAALVKMFIIYTLLITKYTATKIIMK